MRLLSKPWPVRILLALVLVNGALLWLWLYSGPEKSPAANPALSGRPPLREDYSELKELESKQSFRELSDLLQRIADEKGAEYAFGVLRSAMLPPNTDLHLLGHVVGDKLYDQQGAEGIRLCTQEFRNACSHSIVVGLFLDKGDAALPEIAEACRNAPGGSGAYTMCFHGLGHGILAYAGYDMRGAAELCRKTGTPQYNNREYIECVGGSVMEIIGGGFHDRELWARKSAEYLQVEDPLALCKADFMPEEARGQCYVYLTPHLFLRAGGNLQQLGERDFEKAFSYCDPLPPGPYRAACYGGFGKEFVVLAPSRDIRELERMTDEQLGKVQEWCNLAKKEADIMVCLAYAMNSLYWGGENDRSLAIRFCGLLSPKERAGQCFNNLIGSVFFYIQDPEYRRAFCRELPKEYAQTCQARLSQR